MKCNLVDTGVPLSSRCRVSSCIAILMCILLGWSMPAAAQDGLPVVVTEAVELPILRQLQVQGTVTSARSAQLSAATSGQVELVMVDAGSRVMAGDVLLTLDAELAQLQLDGASARVEQAQQAVSDANRRLLEVRKLAPQQSIAESLVLDIQAEVAEDEALLREVKAQAARDEAILARHTVRAPFDGVVAAKLTESGEWVTPGQAIFTLISTTQLRLDFQVAEDFLPLVGPETQIEYSVGPNADARYVGRFATAVPVADRDDRTFLLRVAPLETHPGLITGRSVSATLKIPTGRAGIVVPRDALLRYPDGRAVIWVIDTQGDSPTARELLVETGLQFDGFVEVRDGLSAGDRVVVQGNETLRPGQKVSLRASAGATQP
ncbi:MAG: efflux RND transporter periplasmic adaptor subunit [Halioglobus sp.]